MRIAREKRTIRAMIGIYCRSRHGSPRELCSECKDVLDYALCRLDRCPFGAKKPACADCPIHCYRRSMREQVREVMRYSGPRMLWRHPILAVLHLWDGWRHRDRPDT
ncbi:MAG: nitrous oxide-stimulated promoter family protein [Rhodopirellula sp.]|nr:nitrous oxide-stimulated promoter family protein [Rhodopirellula sp.]